MCDEKLAAPEYRSAQPKREKGTFSFWEVKTNRGWKDLSKLSEQKQDSRWGPQKVPFAK